MKMYYQKTASHALPSFAAWDQQPPRGDLRWHQASSLSSKSYVPLFGILRRNSSTRLLFKNQLNENPPKTCILEQIYRSHWIYFSKLKIRSEIECEKINSPMNKIAAKERGIR